MTNIKLLQKKVDESGMTVTAIAEQCNMLRETYYNRMNGISDFKASEISALTKTLRLTREERDNIFFAD